MSMISRQKLIEDIKKESELHSGGLYEDEMLDIIESQPPAEPYVPLSEVYRVIAGHSNYHGDNILAALTCVAVGKEVKPVRPLPADQWNVIECDEEGILWHLPDEGEEVILSNGVHVWIDTLESDIHGVWFDNYGDIKEGMAWKYAEPYKGVE